MGLPKMRRLWQRSIPDIPDAPLESPEQRAGILSRVTFSWISQLMKTGHRRPLERNDIWRVHDDRTAELLHQRLEKNFSARVRKESKHPLAFAIYDTFKHTFWVGGVCQLITGILQVTAPFTLRYLINYSQEAWDATHGGTGPVPSIGIGMAYAIGISAMLVIQSFTLSHFYYRSSLMGGETRSALIAAMFQKSLNLSRRARAGGHPDIPTTDDGIPVRSDPQGWSNGRIMNLIGTDANRIQQACELFHFVWTCPFQICLTVALLIVNLGYSAVAGVAVLIASLFVLSGMIKYYTRRRASINRSTDERISITQEMLQSVRFIKYFAWENTFVTRLKRARGSETGELQKLHLVKSALGAFSMAIPIFANMVQLIVYSVTGHDLNPAPIFSSLALINGLRTPMNWLPTAIGAIADALASLKRIEDFLLAEELRKDAEPEFQMESAISLDKASFSWESHDPNHVDDESEKKPHKHWWQHKSRASSQESIDEKDSVHLDHSPFSLKDLNLSFARGHLVGVVGSVGCGKTSLLSALASDMRLVAGKMDFCDYRAYCPQYAWIQNCSVRDNIVFGKPFDQAFYDKVIHACALQPDFDSLTAGDMTEIGERGITLSGGQKQRINIARAIYSRAGIVLLDDPLSAVDAHVGNHIFKEAICGLLEDRCRIMATHQLWVLSRCDRIVWMEDGKIMAVGTYAELLESTPAFAKLIEASGSQQNEERAPPKKIESAAPATEHDATAGRLIQEDVKIVDNVSWSVYVAWARASGTVFNIPAILLTQVAFRGINIISSLWISWWVSNKFGLSRGEYIGIFAALGVAQGVVLFLFSGLTCIVGTNASQSMSNQAMWQVLRAPMSFFDTTPMGRIMHRFTSDVDQMDNNLTDALRQFLITVSALLGAVIFIIVYFYYYAIAMAVGALAIVWAVAYYRRSARELKRYHAILDGVVFARFSEALTGANCIKAYGRNGQFVASVHRAIDDMDSAYFLTFANQRWLSIRLDNIGNLLTFVTGLLVALNKFSVPPSISGLALSYALSMVGVIQITVKYLAEVDNAMTSTERLHQYATTIDSEAPLQKDVKLPAGWPNKGAIEYRGVQLRYRAELPLVIDGFSLDIRGGEKIGVVGRTGAGKSTILSSLFRLTELSGGNILIDGVDIAEIGLHDLRSRLSVIPQDPTLFQGTIRSNIDPEGTHSDQELWDIIRKVRVNASLGLGDDDDAGAAPVGLDTRVEEDGLNFSLGQRQLIALARALLRDARIVLVDEGTSSVDASTDAHIQDILANGLEGKTLIAIAHRLRTVLRYDRVCVMDKGKIAEIGSPLGLFLQGGIFTEMCNSSGIGRDSFSDSDEN